jgi:NADH dehydrogenase
MQEKPALQRVVIVGGGFAGLFAARALRRAPVQVTLIDRAEHHLFQPLLYQCATGILSEGKIASPLRNVFKHQRNVKCVMADVTGLDVAARRVVARQSLGQRIEYGYDYLVVAAGLQVSYFGHEEYAVFAPGMKTVADALAIRRRIFGAFEMAESAADGRARQRCLTFAVVGAGPTGVELAGQIREVAAKTLRREYHDIKPEDARVLLFDGVSAPLATFGPSLAARATAALRRLGVELHMGSTVTGVDAGGLEVKDRDGAVRRYDAGTVLWAAGVQAPPLAEAVANATGAERDGVGRIKVGDDLTIPRYPEIFVLGDLMSSRDLPGEAEVAMQSGLYAARRIRRQARRGEDPGGHPFRYRDLGSAAYISRGRAVVTAGPLQLGGFVGWLVWLFIHIAFLAGFRNRVGALFSWSLAFTRGIRLERTFTIDDFAVTPDADAGNAYVLQPTEHDGHNDHRH